MTASAAALLTHASVKVRNRAVALRQAVGSCTRDGDTLRTRVQGSRRAPYRVAVDLRLGQWSCSCPDEYNVMCKHVCATLLVYQASPDLFIPAPAARRLPNVQGWADADVERLLERILRDHPAVARDWARVVDEDESYDDEADW